MPLGFPVSYFRVFVFPFFKIFLGVLSAFVVSSPAWPLNESILFRRGFATGSSGRATFLLHNDDPHSPRSSPLPREIPPLLQLFRAGCAPPPRRWRRARPWH